jgi:hypothetical protein
MLSQHEAILVRISPRRHGDTEKTTTASILRDWWDLIRETAGLPPPVERSEIMGTI